MIRSIFGFGVLGFICGWLLCAATYKVPYTRDDIELAFASGARTAVTLAVDYQQGHVSIEGVMSNLLFKTTNYVDKKD